MMTLEKQTASVLQKQYLSLSSLDHEFAAERLNRRRLERPQHDITIEWIAGHELPVMEHTRAKRLTLGVRSEVRLKSERVDDWYVCLREIRTQNTKDKSKLH